MNRSLLAAMLLVVSGCSGKLTKPPEIDSEVKEGSTKLVFMLTDHQVSADGSQSFSAVGLVQGRQVGFDVRLGAWSENPPGYINMSTWESKSVLSSRGPASDGLLQFLDNHYSTKVAPQRMAPTVECKAFSPWENPGKLQAEPVSLLMLFQGGFDETLDAEVWLDVKPREAKVYLREKEPRFRRALILALAEQLD